ncbi:MAG TPA: hypothetical protein VGX68_22760 [Thermoanaerobaculia bacterium]|jgi:hypothetical protein|nr:hypothetical protein [Thermoanaerobaculia bacterium]
MSTKVVGLFLLAWCWMIPAAYAKGASRQCLAALPGEAPGNIVPFLLPEPETKSGTCSVTCGDTGGTATVSCVGTCELQDQDCAQGQQGYVRCLATGAFSQCPPCQSCTAWTSCPDGTVLECTGWSGVCQGAPLCYVWCGGYHTFCPGHFGEELCE